MANKKYTEQRIKEQRETELLKHKKRLRIYPLISLLITLILLLLMMTTWVAIYNSGTDMNEIEATGFQCASAGLADNYKSIDQDTFGKISFFANFAESETRALCVVTAVLLFVLILHALIGLFGLITNKQGAFNILDIIFVAVEAALFITCYSKTLSMEDILISPKGYCNNPLCSVQSSAIIPALIAILSLALPIVALIRDHKIKAEMAPLAEDGKEPASPKGKGRK